MEASFAEICQQSALALSPPLASAQPLLLLGRHAPPCRRRGFPGKSKPSGLTQSAMSIFQDTLTYSIMPHGL